MPCHDGTQIACYGEEGLVLKNLEILPGSRVWKGLLSGLQALWALTSRSRSTSSCKGIHILCRIMLINHDCLIVDVCGFWEFQ